MAERKKQKKNAEKKELLIVVPAYNESESIVKTIDGLIKDYPEYDYIIINDGSKDDTERLCIEHKYNYISLPINTGLAGAMQTGFKYAYLKQYKYVLQFDGDGQHKAEYIADMLDMMKKEKCNIVIGSRYLTPQKIRNARMFGSKILTWEIKLTTGKTITDPTSGMRLFDGKMIERFSSAMNYGPEPDTVSYLIKCGAKIKEVTVEMQERFAGKSYLNLWRSAYYMIYMCMSIAFVQFFRKKEMINE